MPATRDRLTAIARDQSWTELAAVIDNEFFTLLLTEPDALRELLAAPPEDWLQENPRYLVARDLADNSSPQFDVSDTAVMARFTRWVEESATPAARDVLAILQGRIRFFLSVGRLNEAESAADSTLAIIEEATDISSFVDIVPTILLRVGVAKLVVGRLDSAVASFSDAVRWSHAVGDHPIGHHAQRFLALGHAVAGDITRAKEQFRSGGSSPSTEPLVSLYDSVGNLAEGMIALGSFDEEATALTIDSLDDLAWGGELWWIASHLTARYALYWGDRATAISDLEARLVTHRGLSGPEGHGGTLARSDLSDLYQATGNFTAARHVLLPSSVNNESPDLLATRIRLEVHLGQHDRALSRLAAHALVATGRDRVPAAVLTLEAAAQQNLGAGDRSRHSLADAATAIRRTGAMNMVAEAPPEIRDELADFFDIDPAGLPVIYASPERIHLTGRELDVLHCLRDHPTAKEIALVLHVSPNTAKTYLAAVYRKLAVHTREQALRAAPQMLPVPRRRSVGQ